MSNLLYDDRFMVLADYSSYIEAQAKVDAAYADQDAWTRSAILNVARMRVLLVRPIDPRLHRPDLAHAADALRRAVRLCGGTVRLCGGTSVRCRGGSQRAKRWAKVRRIRLGCETAERRTAASVSSSSCMAK